MRTCSKCGGTGREIDHVETGAEMREIRLSAKTTLSEMASFLSISRTYLWDLEKGKREWPITLIEKIRVTKS